MYIKLSNIKKVSLTISNIFNNIRYWRLKNTEISDKYISWLLKLGYDKLYIEIKTNNITYDDIISLICDKYKLSFDILKSKTRKTEIAMPRCIFYYLAIKCKIGYKSDAAKYLGFHHATALHGYKVIDNLIATNRHFAAEIKELEQKIGVK